MYFTVDKFPVGTQMAEMCPIQTTNLTDLQMVHISAPRPSTQGMFSVFYFHQLRNILPEYFKNPEKIKTFA